jgi:paraquat-inducible protein A
MPEKTLQQSSGRSAKIQVNCHECDYKVTLPELQHKQRALCPRCGFNLTTYRTDASQRIIALAISALIFLLASLPFEFLSFSARGQFQAIDIPGSILILVEQDYALLAVLQAVAILILPAFILLGLLYLLLPLSFGIRPPKGQTVAKVVFTLLPWTMAEIFLIGVLVSLIKITSMADVGMGPSFYAYILFTMCMTATLMHVDKHQLNILITSLPPDDHKKINPSQSIQTTWALLATSILLYIPANTLPIMHTSLLGNDQPSTILGGVILLWQMGSYPIAAVIFIASVFVPVAKLCILCWLNYSVQVGLDVQNNQRIFWYRMTEFVGRWSMVDVFVVAVLVSLIQLGNIMSIHPGYAALAFCGVVIVTMLAAMSFDSRLIWSQGQNKQSMSTE